VFEVLSVVDWGDVAVTPGNTRQTSRQIAEGLSPLLEAGITPVLLGGDHSIVLGELRAHANQFGAVALLVFDAHADTWDECYGERYAQATPLRRAVEEGLVVPELSTLAGLRGSLDAQADLEEPRRMGFDLVSCQDLRSMPGRRFAERIRERVGDAHVVLSFDLDVIDPAFAPGIGTPEVAGMLPQEALDLVRALVGINFVGFDLVELAPAYDSTAQTTALMAAALAYEFLGLRAVMGRDGSWGGSA
jgi:agmatinase